MVNHLFFACPQLANKDDTSKSTRARTKILHKTLKQKMYPPDLSSIGYNHRAY